MYKTSQGEEAPVPKSQGTEIRPSTRDGDDHNEAMDRIFNELLKTQKDFPSIHFEREITYPCSLSDVETALVNVVQAYDQSLRIINTNEEEIKKMRQQHQTLQTKFNNDLDRRSKEHNEAILSLKRGNEKDKSHLEGKISVYEKQEQQHDDRIRRLQREHEEIVNEKIFQIQQLKSDLTLSREKHRGEINWWKEQQREQLMVMKSEASEASAELARTRSHLQTQLLQAQTARTATTEHYERQVKEMTNKHDDEKRQMERRFEDQKSQMERELLKQKKMAEEFQSKKRALEEDIRLAKIDFESQLRETKRQLDQEREGKAKEIETIQNAHDAKMRKMREAFEVEKTGLVRGLKETVESLKGALVERDHFKAMSDHELAHRFHDISIEVDEFARVQWDVGQESLWPFPGQSLRKSDNERRTKQYIIQNTLWVILYERIFCTPFRVLGNEGKSLEAEWIEKFGQGKLMCNSSFSFGAKMHEIPNLRGCRLFVHRQLKNRRNGGTRT
jgi:hypothetical protein